MFIVTRSPRSVVDLIKADHDKVQGRYRARVRPSS
jgi:hypothetical protein